MLLPSTSSRLSSDVHQLSSSLSCPSLPHFLPLHLLPLALRALTLARVVAPPTSSVLSPSRLLAEVQLADVYTRMGLSAQAAVHCHVLLHHSLPSSHSLLLLAAQRLHALTLPSAQHCKARLILKDGLELLTQLQHQQADVARTERGSAGGGGGGGVGGGKALTRSRRAMRRLKVDFFVALATVDRREGRLGAAVRWMDQALEELQEEEEDEEDEEEVEAGLSGSERDEAPLSAVEETERWLCGGAVALRRLSLLCLAVGLQAEVDGGEEELLRLAQQLIDLARCHSLQTLLSGDEADVDPATFFAAPTTSTSTTSPWPVLAFQVAAALQCRAEASTAVLQALEAISSYTLSAAILRQLSRLLPLPPSHFAPSALLSFPLLSSPPSPFTPLPDSVLAFQASVHALLSNGLLQLSSLTLPSSPATAYEWHQAASTPLLLFQSGGYEERALRERRKAADLAFFAGHKEEAERGWEAVLVSSTIAHLSGFDRIHTRLRRCRRERKEEETTTERTVEQSTKATEEEEAEEEEKVAEEADVAEEAANDYIVDGLSDDLLDDEDADYGDDDFVAVEDEETGEERSQQWANEKDATVDQSQTGDGESESWI